MSENEYYKLTETGEAFAVDLIGGQDISNILAAFLHLLKTEGDAFGTKLDGDDEHLRLWLRLIPILKVIRKCNSWETLVLSCEKLLEDETDWFKSHPHWR